jgi:hypothetical protein
MRPRTFRFWLERFNLLGIFLSFESKFSFYIIMPFSNISAYPNDVILLFLMPNILQSQLPVFLSNFSLLNYFLSFIAFSY